MNKKFIALAVAALVSGAANAASIYENDTTTFDLKGEMDTYLSQYDVDHATGTADESYDADVDVFVKVQIDAEHQLSETVKVFGSFEIENGVGFAPGDNDDKDVVTDDEYFGVMFGDSFGIAAGEVGDFGDSLDAITIDNTNEGYGYMDDEVTSFESYGHAISLKYDANGLKLIADTYLHQDEDLDNAYGISASYTVAGFNIGASYQDHGNRNGYSTESTTSDDDNDIYGFKAGYTGDNFSVAAHYVNEQIDSTDIEVIGVAADYTIDATRVYVSAYTADADADEDLNAYTLGVDHAFSDNLTGFVEYSAKENVGYAEDEDTTLALAGMYFTF